MSTKDAILLDRADDVATVLRPIEQGETVSVEGSNGLLNVIAKETIPIFHKIAIKPLSAGWRVSKYGDTIGVLITNVEEGALVHVHNLRSKRAVSMKR
jgi:hypothetical protein